MTTKRRSNLALEALPLGLRINTEHGRGARAVGWSRTNNRSPHARWHPRLEAPEPCGYALSGTPNEGRCTCAQPGWGRVERKQVVVLKKLYSVQMRSLAVHVYDSRQFASVYARRLSPRHGCRPKHNGADTRIIHARPAQGPAVSFFFRFPHPYGSLLSI